MKHVLMEQKETKSGVSQHSWYGTVWQSDGMLRLNVKGMPSGWQFSMDKRVIPQLISVLKDIQNESA